jgi:hypothetical protein
VLKSPDRAAFTFFTFYILQSVMAIGGTQVGGKESPFGARNHLEGVKEMEHCH